jgi:hypothetical protein
MPGGLHFRGRVCLALQLEGVHSTCDNLTNRPLSGGLSVDSINIAGGLTTNILVGGHTFYYTNGVLMNIQ